MKVGNGFTTVLSIVDYDAKSIFKVQVLCYLPGCQEEMSKRCLIFLGGFSNARNGLAWNYEQVDWRLWVDVAEGDT